VAKLQYAESSRIDGCWKPLQVLHSARKLFASRYGKMSTSMSRGRSDMVVVLSAMVMDVSRSYWRARWMLKVRGMTSKQAVMGAARNAAASSVVPDTGTRHVHVK
jgi:hypothetical protein